ncbi:MAG: HAD-IA family hydrolase [Planctomycetales bacterium]|nr:HAD-IA family hydrolase [Planctomycetales bacterium]
MANSPKPLWIAFDAVGTLIHPEPPVSVAYAEAARRHGSLLTADDIRPRFHQAWGQSECHDIVSEGTATSVSRQSTSEVRERQRWRWIVQEVITDITNHDACFEELWQHFARPTSWRCFPDVAETLADLAAAGFRLAVASNFDQRLPPICANLPDLKPIQLCVVSSAVGFRKPSPQFFAALSQVTGCPPDRLLMVGDDFDNDVAGARAAGLPARFLQRERESNRATDEIKSLIELRDELLSFISPLSPAGGEGARG